MIIDGPLGIMYGITYGFMSILPELPTTPEAITDLTVHFLNIISGATDFFGYIYGPAYLVPIIALLIAFLLFDQLYHMSLFVIKKIPLINIH